MKRNVFFYAQAERISSEIALSFQWKTPIIIAVLYATTHVQVDMQSILNEKLFSGEKEHIAIELHKERKAILEHIENSKTGKVVFSITGLNKGGGLNNADAFRYLNLHREYFIENCIRLLLWLKPDELNKMVEFAPDFWAFRHAVIDLTKSRATPKRHAKSQGISMSRFPWTLSDTDIDSALSYRQSILADISDVNETVGMRVNLYGEIAGLYFQQNDLRRALATLQQALDLIPHKHLIGLESKTLFGIATLLLENENTKQAESTFQKAAVLAKNQPEYIAGLAQSRRQNGKNSEALRDINKVLRAMPEDALSWNELGNIYLNLGRFEKSMDAYQQASQYTKSPTVLLNKTILLLAMGQVDAAKELIQGIPCETIKKNIKTTTQSLKTLLENLC